MTDSKAARPLRLLYLSELEKGTRVLGFQEEEGNSQKDERKKCFISKCLSAMQMSLADEKLFLVMALFLLHVTFLNSFRQLRGR